MANAELSFAQHATGGLPLICSGQDFFGDAEGMRADGQVIFQFGVGENDLRIEPTAGADQFDGGFGAPKIKRVIAVGRKCFAAEESL